MTPRLRWIVLAAALAAAPAHAIFGDDEARKAIADLTKRTDARLAKIEQDLADKLDRRAMLDLNASLEGIRADLAALRGQIEVLQNRVEQADRRQRDLYVDLDTRLRKFEHAGAEKEKAAQAQAAEQQAYEAGLAGNAHYALRDYKGAIAAHQRVVSTWPDSSRAPEALLNIASSQAEMGDAGGSAKTLQTLVSKYPASPSAEQAKQRLAKTAKR